MSKPNQRLHLTVMALYVICKVLTSAGEPQTVMRIAAGLSDTAVGERICQTEDPVGRSILGARLAAATVAGISCGTAKVYVAAETKRRIT